MNAPDNRREYFVFHSGGFESAVARTAREALRQVYIPLGFRDVLGVVEVRLIAEPSRGSRFEAISPALAVRNRDGGAWIAMAGQNPNAPTGGPQT